MLPEKVLVIDDSEIVRCCVSDILTQRGIQVFTLPSAIGATVEVTKHDISTVIVDVSMPGLSGDKLVGVFRAYRRTQDLSIIIMTEKSEKERDVLRQTSGADLVISKGEVRQLPIYLGHIEALRHMPSSRRIQYSHLKY